MNDLIQLPDDAPEAAFAAYVGEGEFKGLISETRSGTMHVKAAAGSDIIGKRVVRFQRVHGPSASRRSFGPFLGFRKVLTGYVVEGSGEEYFYEGALVQNFYLREG